MSSILIVYNTQTFQTDKAISGGEVRLVNWIRFLLQHTAFRVSILSPKSRHIKRFIADNNIGLIELPIILMRGPLVAMYMIRAIAAVFRLRGAKSDFVYAPSDFLPDVVPAAYLALTKNMTWVQLIHHEVPKWRSSGGKSIRALTAYVAQRLSFAIIKHHAHKIVVMNADMKRRLVKCGFRQPILVAGTAPSFLSGSVSTKISISNRSDCCLCVGRIASSKGLDKLIAAWKELVNRGVRYRLKVIGGGDANLLNELKKLVTSAGLDELISFTGFLGRDELEQEYRTAKFLINGSQEEGWCFVLHEALQYGLTPISVHTEILEGVYGKAVIYFHYDNLTTLTQIFRGELTAEQIGELDNCKKSFLAAHSLEKIFENELAFISEGEPS
jgi:glycosyltransferase involved in cell wall biosynthesis